MRQRKRGLAILLAMVMLFGSGIFRTGTVYAAGELPSEEWTVQTEETKEITESESGKETESVAETGDLDETGEEETESTQESAGPDETEAPEGSEPTEETESTEEAESTEESETTEETGVSEETAAFYSVPSPTVTYGVHMQTYGDNLEAGVNGSTCGRPGSGKRLEAIKLQISGIADLGVEYQAYSDGKGWIAGRDGSVAGTIGESRRVEAIKASLTGTAAGQYDIYYRVYIQSHGWMDWAKNGAPAGVGPAWEKSVEAIEVRVQAKGSQAPSPAARPYVEEPDDLYINTHVNTGNRVHDIISVAKTQVGYYKAEKTPTKYGTWYGANIANGSAYASAAWCAMFVSWCAEQAGVPSKVFYRHSYTESMVIWYKNKKNPGYWHDKGSYTPQVGDLIFFKFSDDPKRNVDHVGLVAKVSGSTVYTIEGNTSNSVRERSYLLTNEYIVGYATPDYNETGVTMPPEENKLISYSANVEGKGWDSWKGDGEEAGTTGSAKMLKALKVEISGDGMSGGVTYRTHMQSYGWQGWVSDGAVAGVPDGAKRMEAVEIKLTGEIEKQYDIYYRVHSQKFGWLDWAKNGQSAGSEGYSRRVEAIQICLVKKGGAAPGSTTRPFVKQTESKQASVSYSTHCQTYGWLAATADGVMNGTEGRAKRLEGIKINLANVSGEIIYRTHVQKYGWQSWVKNGALSGTTGEAKRLEAIEIKLSGTAATEYDVYYRVHCQSYGWMGWAKNGEPAGTIGLAKRLEAIEIRLVPKGGAAPGSTTRHYVTK